MTSVLYETNNHQVWSRASRSPGYGRQLQRQGDIVQKKSSSVSLFATWLLFPSFWVRCPKRRAGYNIGGFSPPFWLDSGFHALPPCRPALSGCTVFCADFFYRVFFTIPVTFMFVWTIKPLFFLCRPFTPDFF